MPIPNASLRARFTPQHSLDQAIISLAAITLLVSGVLFSLLLLSLAAILSPVAALGLWLLRRKIERAAAAGRCVGDDDHQHGVIEGNYTIIDQ